MSDGPEENLLAEVRRAARLVERGIVTVPEFVGKVYHEFAHADTIYQDAIRPLWASVPVAALAGFVSAIEASASPNFQWRPFYLGPGPSEDERVQGTQRIRAWSEAMLHSRDSKPEGAA